MTLLTICQDAATEMQWDVPAAIVGNPDEMAQRLFRLANRVGRDVMERGLWPNRRALHSFTAVPGAVQPGALPADFGRWVPDSMWRTDTPEMLLGPLDGQRWAEARAQPLTGAQPRWWTVEATGPQVWPPAQGGETLAVEYFSRAFCADNAGLVRLAFAADDDMALVPEELLTLGVIAFALRNEGQPWQPAMGDYERRLWRMSREAQPQQSLRTEIPAAMPWPRLRGGWP